MPKILKNFKKNKDGSYKILENGGNVFADMPVCIAELGEDYDYDILVVDINGSATVVSKEEYLKNNKAFYLVADENGMVKEDPSGEEVYLPKDTDVSKLRIVNGQLALISEEVENIEEEKEAK